MKPSLGMFILLLAFAIPNSVQATNRVLALDGTDDGVLIANPTSYLRLGSAHSMTAWVRLRGEPRSSRSIIAINYDSSNAIAYMFYYSKDSMKFGADFGSGHKYFSAPVDWSNGWVHIAFVNSGTVGRWYINGQLSTVETNGTISRNGVKNLCIGMAASNGTDIGEFSGFIDEVALLEVALTPSTITNKMANGWIGNETGLDGYWDFDDGTANDTGQYGVSDGVFVGDATTIEYPQARFWEKIDLSSGRAYPIATETEHYYQLQGRDSPFTNIWYGIGDVITGTGTTEYGFESGDGPIFFPARRWQISTNTDSLSLDFDGTNDFAFISHDGRLNLTNEMTLEAWVKPSLVRQGAILAKASAPSIVCYKLGLNSTNKPLFTVFDSAGNAFLSVTGATTLATGQWRHVSASWNGAQGKILLDGVLDGSGSGIGTTRVSTISSFLVGGIFGSESFGGLLDQIRVWNIARTESDVLNDYQSILTGNEAGLVSLWRISSGGGQTALDGTSNGLDLTLGSDPVEDGSDPRWKNESFPPASEYVELFDIGESCLVLGHNCSVGDAYQLQSTTNLSAYDWNNRSLLTTGITARIEYYVRPTSSAELFRVRSPTLP